MKFKVSHTSAIPLHEQLRNQLRQCILSGRWTPGHRVPSETELQRQLKISRSTVRQALRDAEIEGLIERVPGRGTYVADAREHKNIHRLIAFVVHDFERPIQRRLLSGAESAARAGGYRIVFCNSNFDVKEEDKILNRLQRDGVSGILLWPSAATGNRERLLERSQQSFLPVTMMDRTFEGITWDYVASDNYSGAYNAMQHLIKLGHRQIVFLSCRILDLLPVAERFRGYQTALLEAGLQPLQPWLIGENNQELSSGDTLRKYCDTNNPLVDQISAYLQASSGCTTAVFAMNDSVALLAMRAASLLGLQVPDDVSIVGFDDLEIASYLPTPLTTVAQDPFAIGRRAAEFLIERIEGRYVGEPRSEAIGTVLRPRASTSAPLLRESPTGSNLEVRPRK